VFKQQLHEETSVKSSAGNRLTAGIKSWRRGPHYRAVLQRNTKLFLTELSVLVSPASPAQSTPFRAQRLTRRLLSPSPKRAAKPGDSGTSAPTRLEQLQEPHHIVVIVREGGSPRHWYSTDLLARSARYSEGRPSQQPRLRRRHGMRSLILGCVDMPKLALTQEDNEEIRSVAVLGYVFNGCHAELVCIDFPTSFGGRACQW
jgi:hypothetical protein